MRALITGIAGQDGVLLSKFLLNKGYSVSGIAKHRTSLAEVPDEVNLYECDITDKSAVDYVLHETSPMEIYNFAAQSHVGYSFKNPAMTCNVNYTGYLNVLLSARRIVPSARIYQAGTSEMFGYTSHDGIALTENAPFKPMSPYAISKVAAYWAGVNARHEAEQWVSNGILFNHESEYRHESFVTRKITKAVANGELLKLGNIDSVRDWGYAGDYVEGMWSILNTHDRPDDFVLASGETHTVREFIIESFKCVGKEIRFEGTGLNEKGYVGDELVMVIDKEFYRPNDLIYLKGDASKAAIVLGWHAKTGFKTLVQRMIEKDLSLCKK